MKKLYIVVLLSGLVALVVAGASAIGARGGKQPVAILTGYQEVPSLSTSARGTFRARIGRDSITFTLTYRGLETNATAAHIHLGQPGVAGGVSAFLCGGAKPACPATSGTVQGTITAADVIGPAAQGIAPREFGELVRAVRAGATYVNVHSTRYTAGEIRGQILPRAFFRQK